MTVTVSLPLRIDDRLLDRLVDGELDETARADLLRSLSAEPDGWKRCATAFLEAQAWGGALRHSHRSTLPRPGAQPMRLARRFSAIAAAVVVAFLTGFLVRAGSAPRSLVADRGVARPATPPEAVPENAPVTPAVAEAELAASGQSTLPDYVRRQLERQGYEVEGDRKTVSVALKDGRQIAVPVETYKYRFVGHRLY